MHRSFSRRLFGAVLLPLLVLAATACGDDDSSDATADDSPATSASGEAAGSDDAPADGSLEDLIAAATEEGALTIYSEQPPDALNATAEAFEQEYPGIDVEVVRDTHPNIAPAAEQELSSGSGVGDIFITTNRQWFADQSAAGNFLELTGPELTGEGDFAVEEFVYDGRYFEIGGAVNVFAWNTSEHSDGISELSDFLHPSLAGRIALVEPVAPVYVDWYYWLEDQLGDGSLEELAELNPRLYQSAVPLNEAIVSGEAAVTPYAFPSLVEPSKESGAPVEYAMPTGSFWGSAHNAAVLASAPHPNAAMLFANFAVTRDAQAILNEGASSVIEDAALAYNGDMSEPYDLSDAEITEFQERFRRLFVG